MIDSAPTWNYLRVRGEYRTNNITVTLSMELPPRARRIPPRCDKNLIKMGTTSACAENTGVLGSLGAVTGNYLRVRGEYPYGTRFPPLAWELPPRARRILCVVGFTWVLGGTTSACAENTLRIVSKAWLARNYLRVRGEY